MRGVAAVRRRLDEVLQPLGVRRRKDTWNREWDPFVDVIDVQLSKARHAVTMNVGVLDREIYARCWNSTPGEFIEEPSCTARSRIGQLLKVEPHDLWWRVDDPALVENVNDAARNLAIPFLERMHSRGQIEEFLAASRERKGRYPPPIISLALLMNERGDREGACAVIEDLRRRALGAWRDRLREISEELNCRVDEKP